MFGIPSYIIVVLWLKMLILSQSGKMLDLIKIDNERIC